MLKLKSMRYILSAGGGGLCYKWDELGLIQIMAVNGDGRGPVHRRCGGQDSLVSGVRDDGLERRVEHRVAAGKAAGDHVRPQPVVGGRRLVRLKHEAVALRDVDGNSIHGVWICQGAVCLQDSDAVVVGADLELRKRAGIDHPEART